MSALNQNQNFTIESPKSRLSHFRYSLDNLVPKTEPSDAKVTKTRLERQNTMPDRLKKRSSKEIVEKLQKIGAQSYVEGSGAVRKAPKNLQSPTSKRGSKNLDDSNDVLRRSDSNVFERFSGDSVYLETDKMKNFVVDNENYSIPLKKNYLKDGFIIENDQYCTFPATTAKKDDLDEEAAYNEPEIVTTELTDLNRNGVMMENTIYNTPSEKSNENLYEDIEKYKKGIDSEKTKHKTNGKLKDKKNQEKKNGVKKSESFIKSVWKRRKNKKEKEVIEEPDEKLYEEIDDLVVEKLNTSTGNAVQMLSELQAILENKKTILEVI